VRGDVEPLSANRKGKRGARTGEKSSFVNESARPHWVIGFLSRLPSEVCVCVPRRNLPGTTPLLRCARTGSKGEGLVVVESKMVYFLSHTDTGDERKDDGLDLQTMTTARHDCIWGFALLRRKTIQVQHKVKTKTTGLSCEHSL